MHDRSPEIDVKHKNFSVNESLNSLLEGPHPFAIWRLPNTNEFSFLLSFDKEPVYKKIDFEKLGPGFALARFQTNNDKSSLFIKADIHYNFSAFSEKPDRNISDKLEHLGLLNKTVDDTNQEKSYVLEIPSKQASAKAFQEKVQLAIDAIDQGKFQKVVLSRKEELAIPESFNPISHFKSLSLQYPSLFCSLVYLPWSDEVWIGASPESLVSESANGIFKTMALAGTQPGQNESGVKINSEAALWSQKEIEEQAMVSRYIINCFKKIRVREFTENGPKTIRAGNLLHLQTAYKVNSKDINFHQLGTVMLDLLHPTSAVCGMPKEAALEFIREIEEHNRDYYSGFLGPINIQNESYLFVNLRTLKVSKNHLTCYAGCGITQGSQPKKEWEETQMKLETVLG